MKITLQVFGRCWPALGISNRLITSLASWRNKIHRAGRMHGIECGMTVKKARGIGWALTSEDKWAIKNRPQLDYFEFHTN